MQKEEGSQMTILDDFMVFGLTLMAVGFLGTLTLSFYIGRKIICHR